eukprot:2961987-Amphidinium_carterae.2
MVAGLCLFESQPKYFIEDRIDHEATMRHSLIKHSSPSHSDQTVESSTTLRTDSAPLDSSI